MTCPICAEDYTKVVRKPVTCLFCDNVACTSCCQTYLLNAFSDAHCMHCRVGWNRDFMLSNFTKTFLNNAYKNHRENILLEREKSFLPASVEEADKQKNLRELRKTLANLTEDSRELSRNLYKIKEKIYAVRNKIRNIERPGNVEKKTFMKACPVADCRGFLSTQWKCGLCNVWVCPKCHEVIGSNRDDEHSCVPENVESANLLKKDSKNCPKCAAAIYKIDGCDQMWCTQCATAFSWNSGQILSGKVHNPHYFEWMRRNNVDIPRDPEDNPCVENQLPGFRQVTNKIRTVHEIYEYKFMEIYRCLLHVRGIEIPRYSTNNDDFQKNMDIRVRYLLHEISVDDLKRLLQKREKSSRRKCDTREIYEMFLSVGGDLFQRIVSPSTVEKYSLDEIYEAFETLRKYINECFVAISKNYDSKVYDEITDDFYVKRQT